MVTDSIIRHLLCDHESLREYCSGKIVSFDNVKLRLLLLERSENRSIPDHYYRMNQTKSLEKIDSLPQLFARGLPTLAEQYLERRENNIYVKQEMQNKWQELITYIPPLLLQAAYLSRVEPILDISLKGMHKYHEEHICPNFIYTSLPHPYIKQLEQYISQSNGLHDLHAHLSGITEVDIVWQDLLRHPDKAQKNISSAYKEEKLVAEQLEQELLSGIELRYDELFKIARKIRNYFFDILFCKHLVEPVKSSESLLSQFLSRDSGHSDHPFRHLFAEYSDESENWMPLEALMYLLMFNELNNNPRESSSSLFHFYILILGVVNRLLVHQKHQYGFEQFQKVTLNDLRENSEAGYSARFLQLHGNERRNIKYIEGRFSPKKTERQNEKILTDINKGWDSLIKNLRKSSIIKEEPELRLIAHFIKERDKGEDRYIRHKVLRNSVWNKAMVLGLMIKNRSPLVSNLVAADAAASEFDAPPDVFAPAFRYLRRKGLQYFTYHAGEDFFHILSGLRAIYEAVEFCELRHGDRIGHGTAMGLSTKQWGDSVGKKIFISKGESLDNLVFAYHLITIEKESTLTPLLPFLESKIQELCCDIYQYSYPTRVIIEAWLMRKYSPMLLNYTSIDRARVSDVFDNDEWCDIERNVKVRDCDKNQSFKLFNQYHSKEFRGKYGEVIELDIFEQFSSEELEKMQILTLKFLHDREIVIETLPTSNVRIGHHHNFGTYHLWNWVNWDKEGKMIPPIVIGTDDPGIFATNIYNEFANIYCYLTSENKMEHNEAMALLEQFDKNGQIYRFLP